MPKKVKIHIDKVSKVYQTEDGRELSLDILEDEFVCIIDPSGCGKTTLLSIIAGLQATTSGRILVDSHIVSGPGRDRGVVFQENAIFLWRKIIHNVKYGLQLMSSSPSITKNTSMRKPVRLPISATRKE